MFILLVLLAIFFLGKDLDEKKNVKPFKYVVLFWGTENTFCNGDHISWHCPLDNSESRIQHMLLTEDPQMQPVHTPFGLVSFLQVRNNKYTLSPHCSCILVLLHYVYSCSVQEYSASVNAKDVFKSPSNICIL